MALWETRAVLLEARGEWTLSAGDKSVRSSVGRSPLDIINLCFLRQKLHFLRVESRDVYRLPVLILFPAKLGCGIGNEEAYLPSQRLLWWDLKVHSTMASLPRFVRSKKLGLE